MEKGLDTKEGGGERGGHVKQEVKYTGKGCSGEWEGGVMDKDIYIIWYLILIHGELFLFPVIYNYIY